MGGLELLTFSYPDSVPASPPPLAPHPLHLIFYPSLRDLVTRARYRALIRFYLYCRDFQPNSCVADFCGV